MIPYFQWTSIQIGPIAIQVWGTVVALGILIGAWTGARYAARKGLNKDIIYQGSFWIIVGAFVGARIFHIFAYEPSFYLQNPLEMFMIWHGGFSVMGGFLGSIIAYYLFVKKHALDWVKYTDAFMYGLPLGLGCGRIGCFLIHDHPGTATNFILGVKQQGGGAIHDLGLYLSINGFVLALVFYLFSKKERHKFFFVQVFLIWYGVARFFLDYLRIIDSRYFGLTPAQYSSLLMVGAGVIWVILSRKKGLKKNLKEV